MFTDKRLRDALEAGRVGVWWWDMATNRLEWSPNMASIHRQPAEAFTGEVGAFFNDIHPEDRERVMSALQAAIERGGRYHIQYRLPPRGADEERWMEAMGAVVLEGDTPVQMLGVCHDVTDQKRTEQDLELRLIQQEVVASLGKFAVETESLQALFDRAVSALAETLQVKHAKVLELTEDGEDLLVRSGVGWKEGLVGRATVGADRSTQAGYTLLSRSPVIVQDLEREERFVGHPFLHDHNVISGMTTLIAGPDETPYGVLGVHSVYPRAFTLYDVNFLQSVANILGSAIQKQHARELQSLLYRELRHRVGNLFAQLLSIHTQTARRASSIEELSEKFGARVQSLAKAHELISRDGWSTISLRLLLETLLEPFTAQVRIEGPTVRLPADMAFAFSLAINELATNAAKHGCLLDEGGRLDITWFRSGWGEDQSLQFDWHENCVDAVAAAAEEGFGSRLIRAVFEQQLGGSLSQHYTETGIKLSAVFPLGRIESDARRMAASMKSVASGLG